KPPAAIASSRSPKRLAMLNSSANAASRSWLVSTAATILAPRIAEKFVAWACAMLPVPRMRSFMARRALSVGGVGAERRALHCDRLLRRDIALFPLIGREAVGVVGPLHGVAQHPLDVLVVIDRIDLVAGREIEDVAAAALEGDAGAEHVAAVIPADEHGLFRLGDREGLAVHLGFRNDEGGRQAGGDRMGTVDGPDPLLFPRLAPLQGARSAHQLPEDLGEMTGVKDDEAHALPYALGNPFDHCV